MVVFARSVLFHFLLLLSALTTITCVFTAEAVGSRESELTCYPVEVEPNEAVQCIISVRDGQREPTMVFNVDDFSVSVASSSGDSYVTLSPLVRGVDITTIAFTVSASMGTELTISGEFNPVKSAAVNPSASGLSKGSLRNSGLKVAVLRWPAVGLGAISCDNNVVTAGLTLRDSTTCSLPLTDWDGQPAVLHSADVMFSEANMLGNFHFIAGKRALTFTFSAPPTLSVPVTRFTLHVALQLPSHGNTVKQVSFPLRYPALPPAAYNSYLRCADEMKPIVCTIAAVDAEGPVLYAAHDFTISMEREWEIGDDGDGGVGGRWINNVDDFDFRHTKANHSNASGAASNSNADELALNPARRDLGLVSWSLRVNNAIRKQRFHVYVRASNAEVRGSPYEFMSGVAPTAPSVTLRGCNVTAIRGGHHATCYADLSNGVSGDVRYFTFTSAMGGTFSERKYVAQDPVTHARTVVVVYTAPTVKTRTDDYITVHVHSSGEAMNSPFRMNVFPVADYYENGGGQAAGDGDAVTIIGVGLAFYGGVLLVGLALVIRRSRAIARIRRERAAKRQRREEMSCQEDGNGNEEKREPDCKGAAVEITEVGENDTSRRPGGDDSGSGTTQQQQQQHEQREPADSSNRVSFMDANSRQVSGQFGSSLNHVTSETSRCAAASGHTTLPRSSSAVPSTPVPRTSQQQQQQRGVVSNAPVDQLRMHSDSD